MFCLRRVRSVSFRDFMDLKMKWISAPFDPLIFFFFLFYSEKESLIFVEITKWISNWTIRYSLITSHVIRGWTAKQINTKNGIFCKLVFIFRRGVRIATSGFSIFPTWMPHPPDMFSIIANRNVLTGGWCERGTLCGVHSSLQGGVITKAAARWKKMMKKKKKKRKKIPTHSSTTFCVCLLEKKIFPCWI